MGRKIGTVLIGLGVLLLSAGLLSKFYAYPRLAVVPANQESVSFAVADDATIFSAGELKEVTTDLQTTINVVGDVKASQQITEDRGKPTVVWEVTKYTTRPGFDADTQEPPVSATHDRVAFDANTGMAVDNCCGTYAVSELDPDTKQEIRETDVDFDGLLLKFPFNTQKKTYDYWDGRLRKALPMAYRGVEKIDGLITYKFVTDVKETNTGTLTVPRSVFGLKGKGDVALDRKHTNTRTLWVEPETGAFVNVEERPVEWVEFKGKRVGTLTETVSRYPEANVKENVEEYSSSAMVLKIVRSWLPIGGTIVGLLLVIAGAALFMRRGKGTHEAPPTETIEFQPEPV